MKLWTVAPLDKAEASKIQEKHNLPPIIAMLLQIRGITSDVEIEDFLYNDSVIADPMEIRDMDKAAARVRQAIDSGEAICVYGDYDADGVTSTALLYSYLETVGANVTYYIPSRESEGYGMNSAAVDMLAAQGVRLIVTVDNGIAAREEIAHAKSLGIDTVVTDHHTPLSTLPEAVAVVDLHREDCPSRFKLLSGVGVAFKLIMALEGEECDVDMLLDNYSDILALGTIGDVVELKGENRVFVKRGMDSIMHTDRAGISALLEVSGIGEKALTAGRVAFTLVPRINAVGRLGHSGQSVELLLTEDFERAEEIAQVMNRDNTERKEIENRILEEIDAEIRRNPALVRDRVIVIDGEGWRQGVVGIVAARVKETFGKPTIIISREGDKAKGSGRSVEGFALCDAVAACADVLTHYGGHPMAAGLSLPAENISLFRKRINEYAASLPKMPYDCFRIDCRLNPAIISEELVYQISLLQPFGAGNPTPVFGFFEMQLEAIIPMGNNKHLRLQVSKGGNSLKVMQFFTAPEEFPFIKGDIIDIAATLEINEYNGVKSVSVVAKDIKASADDSEKLLNANRAFEKFIGGKPLSKRIIERLTPTREDFAQLYRFLQACRGYRLAIDSLVHKLGGRLNLGKIRVMLEAMRQLGLIEMEEGITGASIVLNQVKGKVSLESAPVMKALKEAIK
ncbi:MAG: single-stranded-DNA-specific exonuclease RecJ [Ruminococcus sp.]|nr:single-stranded-DNA-specific exonuclease RecJ [Ruminococcus sp.]